MGKRRQEQIQVITEEEKRSREMRSPCEELRAKKIFFQLEEFIICLYVRRNDPIGRRGR
jgi:hypothetical protein